MHSLVVVLSSLLVYANAQSCDNTYGGYLNCIKGKLDADYGGFEKEFGQDWKDLVFSCFTSTGADANAGKACFMASKDALDNAFNDKGALAQCSFCRKIASQVRKTIVDAPEATLTCIRGHIRDAIGQEMEYCIKQKQASFKMPPLPDFDAGSQNYRNDMIDNVGISIMTQFSLDRCERISTTRSNSTRVKRSSYSNTKSCIDARTVNGKKIWPKHCDAMKACRADSIVPANCKSSFASTEKNACDCIEEGRQKIQNIIKDAGGQIIQIAGKNSTTGIKAETCLKAEVTNEAFRLADWKECKCKALATRIIDENSKQVDLRKLMSKLVDCTDADAETRDLIQIDKLIDIGCKRLARGGDAGERSAFDLASAIQFISQLVDALTMRVTRFCPGTQCAL